MSKINSSLLRNAIADARAVKATALANAKYTLEEAFAPRFHAMFADKLKEEVGEEDEDLGMPVDEVSAPNQVSGTGGEAKGPSTKDVSKGQPKKVSDASTNFKTVAVGGSEGAAGSSAPAAENSIMKETSEAELEDEGGITSQDLDEIIRELEAEAANGMEGEEVPVPEEEPVAPEAQPAPEAEPEVPSPEDQPSPEDTCPEPVAPEAQPVAPEAQPAPEAPAPEVPGEEEDVEEEIDLNALLEALTDDEEEEEEEGMGDKDGEKELELDEAKGDGVPTNVGGQDAGLKNVSKISGKNHNVQGKGNIGSGDGAGKPTNENVVNLRRENEELKDALNEHAKAIKYLQGQINEVNLMNAKLLYVTKLMKEHNLDNKQKMRVVETFDLLKNVREVKLTYASMCEALNFGASNKSKKPSQRTASQRITEAYAGKTVASTKPAAEILSESRQMADRFKKLAGIKSKK